MKDLSTHRPVDQSRQPGLDLLRAYAGVPVVHVEQEAAQHRSVLIERDSTGRIVRQVELLDETVVTYLAADVPLDNLKNGGR